ncbi:MAG TPA: DUF6676 family protein [Aldersonia sp.]
MYLTAFTPLAADLPPKVDVDDIVADLADNHVAAPSGVESKLAPVVAQARNDGIDLEVVVIPENGRHDSQLRDLATAVAQQDNGGTILVLSPDWAGTYSDTLSRVVLEAGEDSAKFTGNPVVSTQNFVAEIQAPQLPWTAITCVLLAGTAAVVGATYYAKVRRARGEASVQQPDRKPVSH